MASGVQSSGEKPVRPGAPDPLVADGLHALHQDLALVGQHLVARDGVTRLLQGLDHSASGQVWLLSIVTGSICSDDVYAV